MVPFLYFRVDFNIWNSFLKMVHNPGGDDASILGGGVDEKPIRMIFLQFE